MLSSSTHLMQMFDPIVSRAHASAAGGKRGARRPGTRPLARRFSTKTHLENDLDGKPIGFHLTCGEASDSRRFELLLELGPEITSRAAMTDKSLPRT